MKKYIFVNDTTTQNNWGCHSTSHHFEKFFEEREIKCAGKIYLRDLHSINNTIKISNNMNLEDVDYIFVNGEGSIYDNQSKGLNMLKSIKILKKRKPSTKVLLVNSTFDVSNRFMAMKNELKSLKGQVSLYGPRERTSFNNLVNLGFNNCYIQPDFLYKAANEEIVKNNNTLVIGGNSNYYRGDRPPYDAVQAYEEIIKEIKKKFDYEIILYSSDVSDYRYMPELSRRLNLRHIGCNDLSWQSALDTLSKARISISGRYHPSIMSLCGMTPCYFISANNCKMQGTHDFFYKENDNFSNSHQFLEDKNKIINWIYKIESDYEREQEKVKHGIRSIKKDMELFSNKLSEILE